MQNEPQNETLPSVGYIGAHSFPRIGSFNNLEPEGGNSSTRFYLSVYAGIIGANLVFTVIRAVLFAFAGLAAASTIHKHMLDTVLRVSDKCKGLISNCLG